MCIVHSISSLIELWQSSCCSSGEVAGGRANDSPHSERSLGFSCYTLQFPGDDLVILIGFKPWNIEHITHDIREQDWWMSTRDTNQLFWNIIFAVCFLKRKMKTFKVGKPEWMFITKILFTVHLTTIWK